MSDWLSTILNTGRKAETNPDETPSTSIEETLDGSRKGFRLAAAGRILKSLMRRRLAILNTLLSLRKHASAAGSRKEEESGGPKTSSAN